MKLLFPFCVAAALLSLAAPAILGDSNTPPSSANGSAAGSTNPAPATADNGKAPMDAYLAVYFCEKTDASGNQDCKLYYAISKDGFKFTDAVNYPNPVLASTVGGQLLRDPMIMRDPDGHTFHLTATTATDGRNIVLFDSTDLVNWTNERLVEVAPPNADMAWAPEIRWDPETKQYFAYWTSSIDHQWKTASIWYATSPDLKTFSEQNVLMQESDGCLDADIVSAGGKWYMVYRFTGIWMRTSDHAFGPYENPTKILDLDVEGPFIFPVNGKSDEWGLIFDYFGGNQGRWGMATSSDLANWTMLTNHDWPYYTPDVFFPPGVRHGCVLPITTAEADKILETLGSTKLSYEETVAK